MAAAQPSNPAQQSPSPTLPTMPDRPLTQHEQFYGADLQGQWPKLQSEEQALKMRQLNQNGTLMDFLKFYMNGGR